MQLEELPNPFQFQFRSELNGAGFVFRLVAASINCYLAEDLKEWLSTNFDECMHLLCYSDLSLLPLRDIKLPILQKWKYQELKQLGLLSELDADDKLLAKLLKFDQD